MIKRGARSLVRFGVNAEWLRLVSRVAYAVYFEAQRLRGFPYQQFRYRRKFGRELNLAKPTAYTEKLIRKMLFDRNPLLPVTSDKLRVRDFAVESGRAHGVSVEPVPLLQAVARPRDLFVEDYPDGVVMKANHGSRMNRFYNSATDIDVTMARRTAAAWLSTPFGFWSQQWAYQPIPRRILVERLLENGPGVVASDYKLFMFHGECALIRAIHDRFGDKNGTTYDGEWRPVDVHIHRLGVVSSRPPPENADQILAVARALSRPFDAVRVDLYSVEGRIYIGELTHYPAAGLVWMQPLALDHEFGERWGRLSY